MNKDWRLDSPGLYEIAGSTALYQRQYGLKNDKESVFILGPTKHPINVSVSGLSAGTLRRNYTSLNAQTSNTAKKIV